MQNAYILYYLAIVGHSMSMFTLVISLAIFVLVRSLKCQRVTLHKNMFLTYVLNSIIIIIHLVEVVPNGELVKRDPPMKDIRLRMKKYDGFEGQCRENNAKTR
ncbi:hypothetical protein J1605_002132 [Eschrichtius robustus]|nr:hypothetical protein J1605_002132 [Eschrichtius robustus]